jgi:hypothetical protein
MPLLEGKQLARNGADMFFISGVDAIAPPPGLFTSDRFVLRGPRCTSSCGEILYFAAKS